MGKDKDNGLPDVLHSSNDNQTTEPVVRKNDELFLSSGRQEVSPPIREKLNEDEALVSQHTSIEVEDAS
ncbi:unnamed protein product, partial [Nesidiocoris tenuis]